MAGSAKSCLAFARGAGRIGMACLGIGLGLACFALIPLACRPGYAGPGHGRNFPLSPAAVRPFALGRPDAVILITGSNNGRLEVCNCAGEMAGGLSRRSGLFQSYRAAFSHVLAIDAGGAFWIEPNDPRNDYILRAYRLMGYDAIVLGDSEWFASNDHLKALLGDGGGNYLSTTVSPADEAVKLPLQTVIKRDWGPIKLAAISDIPRSSLLFFSAERIKALKFASPASLAAQADQLKREGNMLIVVVHCDDAAAEAAARDLRADLVIRRHTMRSDPRMQRVGGAAIVKVGGPDTVGVVAVKFTAAGAVAAMEYRLETVDGHWPVDSRVMAVYQAYAHAAMVKALDAQRSKGLDYAPSSECGRCHAAALKAWQSGPHSRAYRALVEAGRTGDPDCLTCHTSGFGTEKGFYTLDKTPAMAGVNCQDCHRFNIDEHLRKGFKFPKANEDVCTACHTPTTDPSFNYALKAGKVRCPRN